jgi:GNAT superfamily N-acetyltransferase
VTTSEVRYRVRAAADHDTAAVAGLIAGSFATLDVSGWLVAYADERVAVLAGYFTILVGHAVDHGQVDVVEVDTDRGRVLVAAAVWLTVPFPNIPGYQTRVTAACGAWTERFERLEEEMQRAHPQDRGAHAYLLLLATDEGWQNQGLGSALLDQRLGVVDEYGLPSYLEASNARSRELYLRKGYVDCAPVFDLPYDGEPIYPMWRNVSGAVTTRAAGGHGR